MANKKTTTKKKQTTPKEVGFKPFDLDIKNQSQANELIAHLEVMTATAGWHIMKQIIEGNLATLERCIVLKQDTDGKVLDDKQCDELRMKHGYLEELKDKPKFLIEQFKKQVGFEIPTYDPYATEAKQLRGERGSEVGAPKASVLSDEG